MDNEIQDFSNIQDLNKENSGNNYRNCFQSQFLENKKESKKFKKLLSKKRVKKC